jgi:hypothetical protein
MEPLAADVVELVQREEAPPILRNQLKRAVRMINSVKIRGEFSQIISHINNNKN